MKVTRAQKSSTLKLKKGLPAASVKKPKMSKVDTPARIAKKSGKMSSSPRVTRSATKPSVKQTKQPKNKSKKGSVGPSSKSQSKNIGNDSIYDFDQADEQDEDQLKVVLFPNKENVDNKMKGSRKYTGIKRKRANESNTEEENTAKVPKRTLKSKDGNVKLMFAKLNEKKVLKNDKNKKGFLQQENKTSVSSEKQKKANTKISNTPKDSVVLRTPMLRSQRRKPKASVDDATQATSTPSLTDAKMGKSTQQELEAHIMPSPMLSPVIKMSPIDFSPMKHPQLERVARASSPELQSPRPVDRTYSGRGSIGRFPASSIPIKESKKSSGKKRATKIRRQSSKYEDWALKMSLELEEAESYELSLD